MSESHILVLLLIYGVIVGALIPLIKIPYLDDWIDRKHREYYPERYRDEP